MTLYLVQHGDALDKAQDPGRPLSQRGVSDTRRIGTVAAGYGVRPAQILHSGKTRARQTAAILAELLQPPGGVQASPGLGPRDEVSALVHRLDELADAMIVGHLPFLARLASLLVAGDADCPVFAFQNGGIVCLCRDGSGWVIRWALMPQVG